MGVICLAPPSGAPPLDRAGSGRWGYVQVDVDVEVRRQICRLHGREGLSIRELSSAIRELSSDPGVVSAIREL